MAQNGLCPPSLLLLRLPVLHCQTYSSSANRLFLLPTSHSSIARPDLANTVLRRIASPAQPIAAVLRQRIGNPELGDFQEPEGPRKPQGTTRRRSIRVTTSFLHHRITYRWFGPTPHSQSATRTSAHTNTKKSRVSVPSSSPPGPPSSVPPPFPPPRGLRLRAASPAGYGKSRILCRNAEPWRQWRGTKAQEEHHG